MTAAAFVAGLSRLLWAISRPGEIGAAPSPLPPFRPLPAYNPTGGAADDLLNLLAWCVSAAGVAGLLVVGMLLTIQLNRGTPGESSDHFRGLVFVALGCVLGASAGPLVTFFGDLGL
ncbi:hypothetical protein [Micromonospora sp. NPDC092111]|uniref:hypothetical protein n=1 Tax=Micromonospora sp. NPDC092111 TaxID=3364289 RepID=UPI003830ABFF